MLNYQRVNLDRFLSKRPLHQLWIALQIDSIQFEESCRVSFPDPKKLRPPETFNVKHRLPSRKLTVCELENGLFLVELPIQHGDFP